MRQKRAYGSAIDLDGSYEEAYFNLAILEGEEGCDTEAERLLQRAIQLDPDYLLAHGRLGALLRKQGRQLEAEFEFRRCVEIDPSHYWSHLELANTLGVQGREAEAEQQYISSGARNSARPGTGHQGFCSLPRIPFPKRGGRRTALSAFNAWKRLQARFRIT